MDACARRNSEHKLDSVISIIHRPDSNNNEVITCAQCSKPRCLEICPSGAITKREADGIVLVDQSRCAGCGLCALACSYGGMHYNLKLNKACKCDMCGGEPKCVEACPYGVLSLAKSYPIYERLQEDIMQPGTSLCVGCGADLAFRFFFKILDTKDLIIYGSPGCFLPEIWQTVATTTLSSLMTTVASTMTGASRYFRKVGKDATLVAFVGDGTTADIGFQPLSAAAERGEHVIYVCYDNEAYQNTGIQRSSTTPYGAWTMTDQIGVKGSGKTQPAKNVPLIMAMHGIRYTATVSISHLEDFAKKIAKAKTAAKEGFVYIHILAPCPTGWRAQPEDCIEMARLAVETNFFPLWEAERGKFCFTHLPKSIKPIAEFTDLQGRFRHLTKQQLDELQSIVNNRFATIDALTKIKSDI